jgi:hypothetical protein
MLYTDVNEFQWQVDNFGSTYTDTGFGTNLPGHANAFTKGANTQMLVGIAEDCYGIELIFSGGSTSTGARLAMTDLLIDPAAGVGGSGSSWTVAIANLFTSATCRGSTGAFGHSFYFPLYLKAGTAIGGAHLDNASGTLGLRCGVRVFGKPSRPDLLKVGTKVQTLGATTSSATGVTVTPGTQAMGSYSASLGTLNLDSWWWQLGIGLSQTTITNTVTSWDIAANATNKVICAQDIMSNTVGTVEQSSKNALGPALPIRKISSGQDVYVRAASISGAPLATWGAVVYAVQG